MMMMMMMMKQAAGTYETRVNFDQTTRGYKPEESHFHYLRRENIKSHLEIRKVNLCIGLSWLIHFNGGQ
jgi:hypothetical protein